MQTESNYIIAAFLRQRYPSSIVADGKFYHTLRLHSPRNALSEHFNRHQHLATVCFLLINQIVLHVATFGAVPFGQR